MMWSFPLVSLNCKSTSSTCDCRVLVLSLTNVFSKLLFCSPPPPKTTSEPHPPSVLQKLFSFQGEKSHQLSLPPYLPTPLHTGFQFVAFVYVTTVRFRATPHPSQPGPSLIRPTLGHLSEDVYPGSKYVRGNIILVLPYLSSVWSINTSIARWGWERRGKERKRECREGKTEWTWESKKERWREKEGWGVSNRGGGLAREGKKCEVNGLEKIYQGLKRETLETKVGKAMREGEGERQRNQWRNGAWKKGKGRNRRKRMTGERRREVQKYLKHSFSCSLTEIHILL